MQTASSGQGSIKIITTALHQPMHEQLCFNLHLHRTLWGDLYNRTLHRTLWDCTILKSTLHEELCSITCTYTGHYGLHCSKKHYRERYGLHCTKEIHQNYLLHCWTKAPLPILFFATTLEIEWWEVNSEETVEMNVSAHLESNCFFFLDIIFQWAY